MRGASAVQEILTARPELAVRVFVVWEPVIPTDVAPPTSKTLARIHDRRARQYWDRDRALSADVVRSILAAPDRYGLRDQVDADTIVWDTVAVFPAGARWENEFPVPSFYGFPVVQSSQGLAAALQPPGTAMLAIDGPLRLEATSWGRWKPSS